MTEDLSAFDEVPVSSSDALNDLVRNARDLISLNEQIADVESLLAKLNGRANELKTKVIPDAMAQVGQSEFKMLDGTRITVEDFISVVDVKDKKKKEAMALKRIETLSKMEGGDALIKTEVSLFFEKKQHNEALVLVDNLRKLGHTVDVASSVNVQSLKAFVRENLRAGKTVDHEALSLFMGRAAKVELPEVK